MTINENYQYLPQIFLYLIQNENFRTLFKTFAPEISNDIDTAASNPNCSCRNKIQYYINENRQKSYLFFKDFINTNPGIFNLNEFYNFIAPPKDYSGIVEKVKVSEWNEFVKKIKNDNSVFRQFSVSKIDEEYVYVFFI